jgi:mRNA-degrading endonuclease RelE of RelBE toxin-antitoxin system
LFTILISRKSAKFIKKLDKKLQRRILEILEVLRYNPIPFRKYKEARRI